MYVIQSAAMFGDLLKSPNIKASGYTDAFMRAKWLSSAYPRRLIGVFAEHGDGTRTRVKTFQGGVVVGVKPQNKPAVRWHFGRVGYQADTFEEALNFALLESAEDIEHSEAEWHGVFCLEAHGALPHSTLIAACARGSIEFRRDKSLYLNYRVQTEWLDALERFLHNADMAFEKAPHKTPDSMIGLLSFLATNSAQEWDEAQIVFKEEEPAMTYMAEAMLRASRDGSVLEIALDVWDAFVEAVNVGNVLPEVKRSRYSLDEPAVLSAEQVEAIKRNPTARLLLKREAWLRGELNRWRAALMKSGAGRLDECSLN